MSAATLATPGRISPSLSLVDAKFFSTEEITKGRYVVRFARTSEEVEAALKLRFEVFNLELGGGLASSFLTGRDRDELDLTGSASGRVAEQLDTSRLLKNKYNNVIALNLTGN